MQTQQTVASATMDYQHRLKENGDVRQADSAPKDAAPDQQQLNKSAADTIDIKALQRKRAQAEFTRYTLEIEWGGRLYFSGKNWHFLKDQFLNLVEFFKFLKIYFAKF